MNNNTTNNMNSNSDRIAALGQYIVSKTGKNFNFKQIKGDTLYRGVLFSCGADDYLVSDEEEELTRVTIVLSARKGIDYPDKVAKRYTHTKFYKAKYKKPEVLTVKGKKYFIIKL